MRALSLIRGYRAKAARTRGGRRADCTASRCSGEVRTPSEGLDGGQQIWFVIQSSPIPGRGFPWLGIGRLRRGGQPPQTVDAVAAADAGPTNQNRPYSSVEIPRHRVAVIGTLVDLLEWPEAIQRIAEWGRAGESRYVVACNVHTTVTAAFDPCFQRVVNTADMTTSDGAPVTWMLRQLGKPLQRRINGPDLMWRYLKTEAPQHGKVFLYGGTAETLALLRARIEAEFPGIELVGTYSPPFRPPTPEEDLADAARINASGAHVVFVGLGCPKQEAWMARQRGQVNAVMLGVGAAFDYLAGVQARAPQWMRRNGLEWLYRMASEPRRLWRRYVFTNVPFLFMAGGQWLGSRLTGARPAASAPVPTAAQATGQAAVKKPADAENTASTAADPTRDPRMQS